MRLVAALIVAMCFSVGAEAQTASPPQCQLHRYVSLAVTTAEDGTLVAPVTINGTVLQFRIDAFGNSSIAQHAADALHLARTPSDAQQGQPEKAAIPLLSLSGSGQRMDLKDMAFPLADITGTDGVLGSDVLLAFDLDFDLAHNVINLYAKDHCPEKVVYWAQSYSEVPMMPVIRVSLAPSGGYKSRVTIIPSQGLNGAFIGNLDGVNLPVSFNTTLKRARLSWDMAQKLFHMDETTSGLEPGASSESFTIVHRAAFQHLTFPGGVDVANLPVDLWNPEPNTPKPAALELGLNEMRRLHVYVSIAEGKMYITNANPAESPKPHP